eukprot:s2377_g14.t1
MFGELWRVAREQFRVATDLQRQDIEAVMQDRKTLVEEYKKTANRSGYRYLRSEPWPDEEMGNDDTKQEELERRVRPRVEEQEDEPDSPSIAPGEIAPAPTTNNNADSSSSNSREEPDSEESLSEGQASEEHPASEEAQAAAPAGAMPMPANTATPRAAVATAPNRTGGAEEVYRRSVAAANMLDGFTPKGQPVRWRSQRSTQNPYMQDYLLAVYSRRRRGGG